jgi:hypothetical protein
MKYRPRAPRIALLFALVSLLGSSLGAYAAPAPQPAPAAESRAFLPLVARGGAPDPGPDPSPGGPSSAELIAEALARGEIDAEAALTYRAFAAFADPRLPARFRGDDSAPGDDEVMDELVGRFSQLSPAAQETLGPFTIPPYYQGSWWDLRRQPARAGAASPKTWRLCDDTGSVKTPTLEDWRYVDSAGGHVRIWWLAKNPGDETQARALNADIDKIWAHLYDLFGREPPSDGGDLRPCRGGSDAFDISLVDIYNAGEVSRYDRHDPEPGPGPTFMLLNRNPADLLKETKLPLNVAQRAIVIHELSHAFQHAFHLSDDYRWWKEATATWIIHYVETREPGWRTDFEHTYAPYMLDEPKFPLNQEGYHQYGAYLFPFFWQLQSGQTGFIRSSFERGEKIANSLENLNAMHDGGFRKQWPEFTLRLLNTPPVDDFTRADAMNKKVKLIEDHSVALGGAQSRIYQLDGNVRYLTSHAYRFTFPDPTVRSVVFRNPYPDRNAWPTASVRALVKVGGQWRQEDWTALGSRMLCRDLTADRVEELYVVISNSEHADRSHKLKPAIPPRLEASNVACRGWQGVVRYHEWNQDEVMEGVYLSEQTIDFETRVTLKLADPPLGFNTIPMYFSPAADTTIKVRHFGWAYDDSAPPRQCAFDDRVSAPIAVERSRLLIFGDSGAYGAEGDMPTITIDGGDSCGRSGSIQLHRSWWKIDYDDGHSVFVSPDGTKISGRFDRVKRDDDPNNEIYYTWELTALPPE